MLREQIQLEPSTTEPNAPRIIYGRGAGSHAIVDANGAAKTMQELGVTEEMIANSTIYVDGISRLVNRGAYYGGGLHWFYNILHPDTRGMTGNLLRLSTTMRGRRRSPEGMNQTFVHEAVHLAQRDRGDSNVLIGEVAIYGFAVLGAIVGDRIGQGGVKGKALAVLGALAGYQLGYRLAPNEREARSMAGQVKGRGPVVVSTAIRSASGHGGGHEAR